MRFGALLNLCLPLGLVLTGTSHDAWAEQAAAKKAAETGLRIQKWENTRLGFFSSMGGEAFARFEMASLGPATSRIGPFQVATPGVLVKGARVEFFPRRCKAEDWADFLDYWKPLAQAQAEGGVRVRLPDGGEWITQSLPRVSGNRIIFTALRLVGAGLITPGQSVPVSESFMMSFSVRWTPEGPVAEPFVGSPPGQRPGAHRIR